MLKVKLKHAITETKRIYTILTDHDIPIVRTGGAWDDTTTCLVKNQDDLYHMLNTLNKETYHGVSLISARLTLATIWETIFGGKDNA